MLRDAIIRTALPIFRDQLNHNCFVTKVIHFRLESIKAYTRPKIAVEYKAIFS